MNIVLGATGRVGSAVADSLLDAGEQVTAVTRNAAHAARLRRRGATVAEVDVADVDSLRAVFHSGRRAFLLNPPADPSTDTDVEERRTVEAIVAALDGSGLEKVVVASTYGARPGRRCGDLTVLHELEEGTAASGVPTAINRAAYYFSNWDQSVERARQDGTLLSMFPADLVVPMVDPRDVGAAGARRLIEPVEATGIVHIEGPSRYTANDVAGACSAALGRPVHVTTVPADDLEATFTRMGFSPAAARSYAAMTETLLDGVSPPPDPERGSTELSSYLADLVHRP